MFSRFFWPRIFNSFRNSSKKDIPKLFRAPDAKKNENFRKPVFVGAGITLMASVSLVDFDPIKNASVSSKRAYRVVLAGFLCFSDYKKILSSSYITEEERQTALSECHLRCAERSLKVFEDNGGIFIKIGQHLSAMNYIIPKEWTSTMVKLQDRCPSTSIEDVDRLFKEDTGSSLNELFDEFIPEPLGVASLAQVHKGKLRNSDTWVAVKIQHPSVTQNSPVDLIMTRWVFRAIKTFFPDFKLTWLADEMEVSLPQELDFTREAINAIETKEHFAQISTSLYVPAIIWSKPRILVMEYVSGGRIDNSEYFKRNHISKDLVSTELCHIFNEMIFGKGGHLHCDPHGGNVFIRNKPKGSKSPRNFEIVLLDHGLYRNIPNQVQVDYANLWLNIIDFNEEKLKVYAQKIANVSEKSFPLFAAAITGRPYKSLKSLPMSGRDREEEQKKFMNTVQKGGMLQSVINLLSSMPRLTLLLMKTNDLVRSLDESLQTHTGSEKIYLIMARYCLSAIHRNRMESLWNSQSLWLTKFFKSSLYKIEYSWSMLRFYLAEDYFYYKHKYFY
ncbi:ABC1 kinase family protein, implicted in mitochondrial ergosterol and phospholipid homeostasis [Schizosaccharomyces osmophilus]|uniref:ABC1 kinase family protein, implicted in mitochondrial ergosterol and phospholipid homeostasis n=1 Tax=Schizosaccharomyces osmophilus TaxID=2545709 RepID=A0AAE9WAS2_9SCHI|nr:ABC1 kinase family protein, implicted in mitochondrial ergosterol and phospholipid homeostasis [Schizosaccharomyces osmophilus]WBW71168.1 ABC1 kinase family protein, implicted in mitochondrial ergosterol and phospholipid homeostasis [Schizosaccharomyces osmophilus]